MSQLQVDLPGAGLEVIQRGAFTVLYKQLNTFIGECEAAWEQSDLDFAEMTGVNYVPTTLERVEPENFHAGHTPSLIGAPVDQYPNVVAMCYRATPGPGTEQYDHQSKYRASLIVETMVRGIPDPPNNDLNSPESLAAAAMVNSRAQRMVEAVHVCLMANPTLGGVVSGFDGDPTSSVTELFTRKEKTAYGPHWYWQGGRIEYAVRKEASLASTHGPNFRSATYEGLEIDQA